MNCPCPTLQRWMLTAAGIAFEHEPVDTRAKFLALRDEEGVLPFGQLPLLRIDGLCLAQCMATMRYVARKGGLWPASDPAAAQVDMLVEACKDVAGPAVGLPFKVHRGGEEEATAQQAALTASARTLGWLEKWATKAEHPPHLVGAATTAADVVLAFAVYQLAQAAFGEVTDSCSLAADFPAVWAVAKAVWESPSIKAYLAGPQRYPRPGPEYVKQVDTVLGRV